MAILEAILAIFSAIGIWFVETLNSVTAIFWTPGVGEAAGELTVIGVLAVITFGIAIITMFVAMVRSFIKGRG